MRRGIPESGTGFTQTDIETVWTAIALHTRLGIPKHMHPVVALVTAGVVVEGLEDVLQSLDDLACPPAIAHHVTDAIADLGQVRHLRPKSGGPPLSDSVRLGPEINMGYSSGSVSAGHMVQMEHASKANALIKAQSPDSRFKNRGEGSKGPQTAAKGKPRTK
ncbi:hypothetical protein MES5069_680021 [Mesorhizobium escarrei]|uniref:Uncharacterized protein n=1 Tax=Mesorhizobium escarrei TaxID=666018 RepID=A0ABN8KFC2_9HYPH|nr:hypothetical protein MES5069_680021 [Mesorhizobium escarrei]